MKNNVINANGTDVRIYGDIVDENAYICITDIAKYKNKENAFANCNNKLDTLR